MPWEIKMKKYFYGNNAMFAKWKKYEAKTFHPTHSTAITWHP